MCKMTNKIKLKVWGDFACFSRPEMKVERVSYDVITPSAARGILEAIFWRPQIKWIIHRICVLNPIQHTNIRRNEIDTKIPLKGKTGITATLKRSGETPGILAKDHRQQRAALILKDVFYGIEAQMQIIENNEKDGRTLKNPALKFFNMFIRRTQRGQYFHHPYLGNREFPAHFELTDSFPPCPTELRGTKDLGLMLQDIQFTQNTVTRSIAEATPHFFHAVMKDGVILIPKIQLS